MYENDLNICFGGEAGQGLNTIGMLLAEALTRSGHEVLVSQTYHSRIRGGHNTYRIRCCDVPPPAPRCGIDLLIALNEETADLEGPELADDGLMIIEGREGGNQANRLGVPFEELTSKRYINTAALGIAGAVLGLERNVLEEVVKEGFGGKVEKLEKNLEALAGGYDWGREYRPETLRSLPVPERGSSRLLLTGNDAIALAAMSAGLKFGAFYPMTPATSIMLTVISHADTMGCVVEQAEDEIAAFNMALGASFAGAPSMVATSGGGFALMTEGLSLAGMTETPVVVVVAQRPAPATGLPTRTEQADLEFVLHGGHGEFPRAVFAPGTVEQCFRLTRKAFRMTESYQSPVIILTDQFLADSLRTEQLFETGELQPVVPGMGVEPVSIPYGRYEITDSGISPRLLPGRSRHLVVADSDEHTPDGHITEDLTVRIRMVDKRLRKMESLRGETESPELEGERDADLLLLCWGSSRGAVKEAARRCSDNGRSAAFLHFRQVWPLVPEQFKDILESAGWVVAVEGNATGQFARLIFRETGFAVHDRILRYDGLPFTAEYILDRLGMEETREE